MYRASPAYSAPRRIRRRRLHVHVGRVLILGIVSTMVAMQVVSAAQTVVTFTDFADKSTLQLNGNTPANNPAGQTFLRLTTGLGQAGSAFLKNAITLADDASFSSRLRVQDHRARRMHRHRRGRGGRTGSRSWCRRSPTPPVGIRRWYRLPGPLRTALPSSSTRGTTAEGILDNNGNHVGIDLEGSTDSVGSVTAVAPPFNDGNVWNALVDSTGTTDL